MSEREHDDGRCCENGFFGQQHDCRKEDHKTWVAEGAFPPTAHDRSYLKVVIERDQLLQRNGELEAQLKSMHEAKDMMVDRLNEFTDCHVINGGEVIRVNKLDKRVAELEKELGEQKAFAAWAHTEEMREHDNALMWKNEASLLANRAESYRAMLLKLCDTAEHVRHSRYPERAGINEMAVVVKEIREALAQAEVEKA